MHHLHLLRHAKAERGEASDDRARALSKRGRAAARRIGEGLPAAVGRLDLVLCSPALRTRETAALVLAGYRQPPRIVYDETLYLAGRAALLRRLRELDEAAGAVLLIGHNPGLHELAVGLAAPESQAYEALASGKFPTGARASLAIAASWAELGRARHPLVAYATPKSLDAEAG